MLPNLTLSPSIYGMWDLAYLDATFITENWISENDQVEQGDLRPSGYDYQHILRHNRLGGEIVVVYRSTVKLKLLKPAFRPVSFALREESSQTNVILQYKLLAAILSAVCIVIQQSQYVLDVYYTLYDVKHECKITTH